MLDKITSAHITTSKISLQILLKSRLLLLKAKGIRIYGLSGPEPLAKEFENGEIKYIPIFDLTRKWSIWKDIKAFFQLIRILKRKNFHIVNTYGPKPGFYGRIAAKIARVPIILHTNWGLYFSEDSSVFKKVFYLVLEWIGSCFSNHVFSVNKDDIETMIKYRIVKNRRKITYIGNATTLSYFSPEAINQKKIKEVKAELGIEENKLIIGMVGRLVKDKGYEEFFRVAKTLKKKYNHLIFLSVGPVDLDKSDRISKEVIERVKQKGIVNFLGMRTDMPYMYAIMDIVVLPSHREGFPRSLVEACAMGKPLVATNIRGCREAVDDGINGFLVPLKDWKSLCDAIEKLIVNEDLRKKMGKASRKKALKEFDENKLVEKIAEVYNKLLREKGIRL